MRNDRDYQSRNYHDVDRERERHDEYRNNRSFEFGNGKARYERNFDHRFVNRAQEHGWDYDRSLGDEMEYDRSDARRGRGLGKEQGYNNQNRTPDYRGRRNYDYNHNSALESGRSGTTFDDRRQPINSNEYRRAQDFSHSNGGDMDRGRMYGRYNHGNRSRGFSEGNRDFGRSESRGNANARGYDSNSRYGTTGAVQQWDRDRGPYYDRSHFGRGTDHEVDRHESHGWRNEEYRRDRHWD